MKLSSLRNGLCTFALALAASCGSDGDSTGDEPAAGAGAGGEAASGAADPGGTTSAGGTRADGGDASGAGGPADAAGASSDAEGGGGSGGLAGGAGGTSSGSSGLAGASSGGASEGGAVSEGGAIGDGGAGGADGTNCGAAVTNPWCDDNDPTTLDFESKAYPGCAHWRNAGPDQGWLRYDAGFHYDPTTGLAWTIDSTPGTQEQTKTHCSGLILAGLSDWRMPIIDEARSLAAGCPDTAPGGSCRLRSPWCTAMSCGQDDDCSSCLVDHGPHDGDYCRADILMTCPLFHTSTTCSDCDKQDWRYYPNNGSFGTTSITATAPRACVMTNIPTPTPCL